MLLDNSKFLEQRGQPLSAPAQNERPVKNEKVEMSCLDQYSP
jgi:hypothetical protein